MGYSLGGTSGMVYASTRDREAADSIKMMVVMTPTTHTGWSCTGLLKYLLCISYNLQVGTIIQVLSEFQTTVLGNRTLCRSTFCSESSRCLVHKKCAIFVNTFFVQEMYIICLVFVLWIFRRCIRASKISSLF